MGSFRKFLESTRQHYETNDELIEKAKKMWRLSDPYQPKFEFVLLPVSDIQPNLGDFYESRVKEIQDLIENDVPLPPIIVRPPYPMEKKYSIRDGTHRHLASMRAGRTLIPALIRR